MRIMVAVDGAIADGGSPAVVPVTDRGFLYGDSVYEVVRTYGGRPFALAEHLERLRRSAEAIEIEVPWSAEALATEVEDLVRKASWEGDKGVRIVVTRGSGPLGLDPDLADRPRRVVIVFEPSEITDAQRRKGVAVVLVAAGKAAGGAVPGGAKTGNYLTNVMALRRARGRGAFEAIMVDTRGCLSEGTTSNFFLYARGALRTPPLAAGILDGITRRHVIGLSRAAGIDVIEEDLRPLDIYTADEVFLTSTLKEILPVTTVDEVAVADGLPGPVTTRLRFLHEDMTRSA